MRGSEHDDSFVQFVNECGPRLYRVAFLLTGQTPAAEDLYQAALTRSYTAWHRVRQGDAYRYVRRVLVNLHTDLWRTPRTWRERSTSAPPDRAGVDDPATTVVDRERVSLALRVLTRRERAVVVLRYFVDLSERDTAEDLGVTVGTVKSTTARALAKLQLSPDLAEPSEEELSPVRDITELRQAMAAETADLTPRTTADELLSGGRRRARRRVYAATAAVALVASAAPVGMWAVGAGGDGEPMVVGSGPYRSPPASGTGQGNVGPSDPFDRGCPADAKSARAIGDTIWTGTTNSKGKDLVVRFTEKEPADTTVASVAVGLGDSATGRIDDLGCIFGFDLPPNPAAYPRNSSAEYDGPGFAGPNSNTTIIGTFVGPADRITATYDGTPLDVEFVRWSAFPQLVVYWITGVPANKPVNLRNDTHPLVTIYDADGKVIGPPQRNGAPR